MNLTRSFSSLIYSVRKYIKIKYSLNIAKGIENSLYQMAPVFMPNDGERLRRIKVKLFLLI